MSDRCDCERKKLARNGTCRNCGRLADLSLEEMSDLAMAMMRCVGSDGERRHLVRSGGRKRLPPA